MGILFFLTSCATADVSVKRGYDFSQLKNIGVISFDTPGGARGEKMGQLAGDLFSKELLRLGFSMIERSEVEKVMEELKLGQSGVIDPSTAKEVGKVAGVDAIVFGSLTPAIEQRSQTVMTEGRPRSRRGRRRPSRRRGRRSGAVANITNINVTAKMVKVQTGEILWVGTAKKDSANIQTSIEKAVQSISKRLNKEIWE